MAEYFRDRGQHALVVIDDLTKHAATHREIALLTRQSPGREAYPGDVFYVHARLLERAAKLSKEKGGGSLTALPIAETDAGNLSAYIPTNLISITDGQIVLDAKLFHEGQKPAVDVGTSVSRVGGKTQAHALREAAETLRLDYAQFLELEMFTRFGGMPDTRVRNQLTRGARIRAILDQPQHAPLRLADEVALVLAVQSGLLDPLPLPVVAEFRQGLRDALDRGAPDAVRLIQETGTLDDARQAGAPRDAPTVCSDRHAGHAAQGGQPAMTERLADIGARIDGIRQLGAVVNAMRGIAAARAQQARSQLVAVDSYAATIAVAIGRALALVPSARPGAARQSTRPALVLFCAEQGFAGAFSERVLDAVGADLATSELFLIGTRGGARRRRKGRRRRLEKRHAVAFARYPQARRPHRRSALRPYRHGRDRPARRRLQRMAAGPRHPCRTPPPVSLRHVGFPRPTDANAPLLNLAPEALLSELTADYLHAQLCNAALHAFAAENEARMEAMAAARNQIERQLSALQATQRHGTAGGDHGGNHRTCRRRDGEPVRPQPTTFSSPRRAR